MPEELQIAFVCEKMKWTWQEYLDQPVWLIETIILKHNVEAEIAEDNLKK